METFSIELSAEKIDDPRTRAYFREVYSSYVNNNYRSATVMLWTVVICDLLYKLQNLRDMYNDSTATTILDEIEKTQKQNPSSPEWEFELLKAIKERTELLDNAEFHSISSLRNYRHFSAHPVLGTADLLYSPNKDTVRSLMRNALESILLKPPILSRKIFTEFITDIADKKELLPDKVSLKRYLEAKYLKNLKPAVENYIFRNLWKFCFSLSNPEADENRNINVRALQVIYTGRANEFKELIKSEPGYYSNVVTGEPLNSLIEFVSRQPSLYETLNENARILLKNATKEDLSLFAISVFLSDSVDEHLEQIKNLLDSQASFGYFDFLSQSAWDRVCELAEDSSNKSIPTYIAINSFVKSGSFDSADISFTRFIEPNLPNFSAENLLEILTGIEQNSQIYGRRRASADNRKIKQRCDEVLTTGFDYSGFSRFLSSVGG